MKENIKAPRHWPLWGEFTSDRWIPRTKGQWRVKCFHLMTLSCFLCYVSTRFKTKWKYWLCWWGLQKRRSLILLIKCFCFEHCRKTSWHGNDSHIIGPVIDGFPKKGSVMRTFVFSLMSAGMSWIHSNDIQLVLWITIIFHAIICSRYSWHINVIIYKYVFL